MDKEEFRIKLEEINHLVEKKDYKAAMNVVDSIDWRRVRSVRTLCVVGEIYAANKRYEDSKEIFLLAYHRASIGKNILYRLIEVSLKMSDLDEAMEFYKEFEQVAPNDSIRYVLKYKIEKAKRAPYPELIELLEEYKKREYTERWSYELAKLYYKAGNKEKCLEVCDDLILWFSEGKYVLKALDLKMRMGVLTGREKEKYEQQFVPKLITPQEAAALKENGQEELEDDQDTESENETEDFEQKEIESIRISNEEDEGQSAVSTILETTGVLQDKIAKGIKDIFGKKFKKEEEELYQPESNDAYEEEESQIIKRKPALRNTEEEELVPDLEPEDIGEGVPKEEETKGAQETGEDKELDFSKTIKMPELKIPGRIRTFIENTIAPEEEKETGEDSQENLKEPSKDELDLELEGILPGALEKEPAAPEMVSEGEILPVPNLISPDEEEGEEETSKPADFTFNLEETILAAASAQGIEIPDEEPKQQAAYDWDEPQQEVSQEEAYDWEEPVQEPAEESEGPEDWEEPQQETSEEEASGWEEPVQETAEESEEPEDWEEPQQAASAEPAYEELEMPDFMAEETPAVFTDGSEKETQETPEPEAALEGEAQIHPPKENQEKEASVFEKAEEKVEAGEIDIQTEDAYEEAREEVSSEPENTKTEDPESAYASVETEERGQERPDEEPVDTYREFGEVPSLEPEPEEDTLIPRRNLDETGNLGLDEIASFFEKQKQERKPAVADATVNLKRELQRLTMTEEERRLLGLDKAPKVSKPAETAKKEEPKPEPKSIPKEEKKAPEAKASRPQEVRQKEDNIKEEKPETAKALEKPEHTMTEEEKLEQFIERITPKEEKNPFEIVPRQMQLTEEEEKLFTYFVKIPGLKEQLLDALLDVQLAASDKTSKTGNVIVMGSRETGKTRLISGLIPAICKELNMEAAKVAYVFADQINGKDIARIVDRLAGGFLVIEAANQMAPETVEQLNKAMEFRTDGLTVILEDEKIGMRKLIAKYPKFAKKFTSMINIPVFTNDELVNFAKIYTQENGYIIDQMGMLALYNLIGVNQKEDEPMTIGGVKDLVDAAIAKSQSGVRKLKRNISKTRSDKDGNIILYEKDFS